MEKGVSDTLRWACPHDWEKCHHCLPFRNFVGFFLFHNKLYESQQVRHLPKAVIPGEFSLLLSIRSVLAVDSTLNYWILFFSLSKDSSQDNHPRCDSSLRSMHVWGDITDQISRLLLNQVCKSFHCFCWGVSISLLSPPQLTHYRLDKEEHLPLLS